LTTIHKETGLEQFLVAGSWSSAMIAKVLSEWDHCNDLNEIGFNPIDLVANDIDVYYGTPMMSILHCMLIYMQ
jgi:hypothetical protein